MKFFSTDQSYNEMIADYTKIDGVVAIGFFAICMLFLHLAGQILIRFNLDVAVPFVLATIALVFVIIRIHKQGIKTIGITKSHLLRSSLVGLVLSAPFVVFAVIPRISAITQQIQPLDVLYSIFFYLVIVSFGEEIVFRGYIQPRLHGLIWHNFSAIIVGGVMFSLMHIPFQAALYYFHHEQPWLGWANPMQWLVWIGMHVVFNAIYRKYNSLAGPVILHFFVNFTIVFF